MPLRMTTRRRVAPGPRRRAVLAWPVWAGAALAWPALTGCADTVPRADVRTAHRQAALLTAAAAESGTLLNRYDDTAAVHPGLAARLAPLRAQVALHIQAFTTPAGSSARPSPSASATPSPAPSSGRHSSAVAVPADPDRALKMLADDERRIAAARTAALRDAPAEFARLLASVAACGAGHALLLSGGAS